MKQARPWTAAVLILSATHAAAATDENARRHAVEYATLIARAHDVLSDYIEHRSTAEPRWTGNAIPGRETGWRPDWTEAGIRARYCDGELLVYMESEAPKGIGRHHRDIQMAPRLFLGTSDAGLSLPPLHWLEDRKVKGEEIGTLALPSCMESLYAGTLPDGRAALMLPVADPWRELRLREHYEFRDVSCGPGRHGDGVRERRRVIREQNGRGDWTDDPVYESWEVLVDTCRDDYVYHRTFGEECTWYQGEPFNREMKGVRRWRQAVRVSAEGEQALGTPVLVGTTCWNETDGPPAIGDPTTVVGTVTQGRDRNCETGYEGTVLLERTQTTTTTTVPWDDDPFVTVSLSAWQEVSNSCELRKEDQFRELPGDSVLPGDPVLPGNSDIGERGCPDCGRPGDPCDWGGGYI